MRRKIIPYNPKLKDIARKLRNSSTKAEMLLWTHLKDKQMAGYDFDRQKPIDQFIVDFFCYDLMPAIEIDGCTHDNKISKDQIRQNRIEQLGITFLRFLDSDVKNNLDGVLSAIEDWIKGHTRASQPPL